MGQREVFIKAADKNDDRKLSELLQEQQIFLESPCGGKGSCGRCRVQFLEGAPQPTAQEKRCLTVREQERGIRLACQTRPQKDCRILVPENGGEKMAVLSEGTARNEIWNRKREEKSVVHGTADIFSDKMPVYGFAVDIGTTTLVMALYDLSAGIQIGVKTSVNHQRAYGADVLSRIHAANQGRGSLLQKTILNDLRQLVVSLLHQCRISPTQVKKMVIAGNTTMCHLLLGYSTETLGSAPFTPVDISWIERSYEEIFHSRELTTEVTILPGISTFVGADIVAGIYASGMAEREENVLFLDVGTNGEMAIGNRDGILVTSTAAGPVFEGGGIRNGMPGVPGAVSHLSLTEQGLIAQVQTIGEKPAIGLCGSAIVDFISELVRNDFVDENGTLREPWFSKGIPEQESKLCLCQSDIREFQMGKAAIRAGIELLIQACQKDGEVPEKICLAGGFGYGLTVESAIRAGMFPPYFAGKVEVLGNSALLGASRCLLLEEREQIEQIVKLAKSMNLAEEPGFYDIYVDAMQFGKVHE